MAMTTAATLTGKWSITFANGDVFSEPQWCAIDKFERQRMLLARPPATFRYAAHLIALQVPGPISNERGDE